MSSIPFNGIATHVALSYFKDHPRMVYEPESFERDFDALLRHYTRKLMPDEVRLDIIGNPQWRARIISHWRDIALVIGDIENDEVWIEPSLGGKRFFWRKKYHRPPMPDIVLRQGSRIFIIDVKVWIPGSQGPFRKLRDQLTQFHYLLYREFGDRFTYEGYGLLFKNDDTAELDVVRHTIPLPLVPSP